MRSRNVNVGNNKQQEHASDPLSRRARHVSRRALRRAGLAIIVLALLLLATFAVPLREWRTGELPAPPLPLREGSAFSVPLQRIWIDTDAACGTGEKVDVDDCLALLLLADADVPLVGISTVFGNASIDVTERTTRELIAMVENNAFTAPPVFRGAAVPMNDPGATRDAPAFHAIRSALKQGPMTIIALGPLTNVAVSLKDHQDLQANVAGIVAVMGHRIGHLFHPAEGKGRGGFLFGHGPVFRDFNFAQDREAVRILMEMHLPLVLVPYDAARGVLLNAADLDLLAAAGSAARWVSTRSRGWLDYWNREVGLNGFYPFDLTAAAYAREPRFFGCAKVNAWIAPDPVFRWLSAPASLLVGLDHERPKEFVASGEAVYCPRIHGGLHDWLMDRLVAPDRLQREGVP